VSASINVRPSRASHRTRRGLGVPYDSGAGVEGPLPPCSTIVLIGMLKSIAPVAETEPDRPLEPARARSNSAMNLHPRILGGPVTDPPGNAARSSPNASAPGQQLSRHRRHEMVHVGCDSSANSLGRPPTPAAYFPRSVAEQIDDHDVLGAVLFTLQESRAPFRAIHRRVRDGLIRSPLARALMRVAAAVAPSRLAICAAGKLECGRRRRISGTVWRRDTSGEAHQARASARGARYRATTPAAMSRSRAPGE